MTSHDLALMAAILAGGWLFAAAFGWHGGDARRDVALLGGAGLSMATVAAALFAF